MADFLNKTFVAANGTLVPAHDASWSLTNTAIWGATQKITNNRVYSSTPETKGLLVNSATPPSADYEVSASIRRDTEIGNGGHLMIVARYSATGTGAPYGYMAWFTAWGYFRILKLAGGYDEVMSESVEGPPISYPGGIFTMRLRVVGAVVGLYVNESETPLIEVTDSSPITGAGKVAFGTNASDVDGLGGIISIKAGDVGSTAPVLSGPTASATGSATAAGSVSTSKSGGTLYYLASNGTPDATAIKAGGSQAVSATGVQSVSVSSLTPSSPYRLHFVHVHPDGESSISRSAEFYTQDVAGARDTPEILGTNPSPYDLGTSASPADVTLTVPALAKFVQIEVDIAGNPSGDLAASNPITTDFTGAGTIFKLPQSAAALGRAIFIAPVTSTGAGKFIRVRFAANNDFTPSVMHVTFLDKVDPLYPLRRPPAFAASADGAAAATASTTSAVGDLVLVNDGRADNDSVAPALGTGFTALGTPFRSAVGGVGYASHRRVKRVTTPANGTASATTQNTLGSAISITAFRGSLQVADTTAPTLSGSITEVSKNASSISISWPAGSDNVGVAGYDVSRDGGSSWTSLGNVLTHTFTGLSAGVEYQIRVRARDAANNLSTPALSTAITTPAPDVTLPTLTGSITVGAKSVSTISFSWPAGSDNVAVTSYEVSKDAGSTWVDVGNVLSHEFAGLTAQTAYGLRVRAKDAAGNLSTPALAASATTWPDGVTVAWLRANEDSFMSQCVQGSDLDTDWFSWTMVTPPASGDFTEGPYANGTFVFEAEEPASMVIALRKNDVFVGNFTVYLYDQADETAPTLSSPTGVKTNHNSATGTVTTDEGNGTLYYLASTSASVTAATVVATGASKAVTAEGSQSVTFTGLSASTTYYAHYVQEDDALNRSARVSSAAFTTDAAPDVTAPTLSSATASATGETTASGSVSTNEANGTLYHLVNTSASASAAAVKAGQSQAVTATGVQNVSRTGLTAGTSYYWHFLHRDAAGNDSAVMRSAQFTTTAPDTTAPTLSGSITITNLTTTGYDMQCPAGADNVAVTGYEYSLNGGTNWTNNGASRTASASSRTPGATDQVRWRCYDAAGNRSAALSVAVTLPAAPDTTPPTLTGSISVSGLTHSGYVLSWPAGSDNVGVTGFDVSLDGGTNWTTQGAIATRTVSGRTPESTDQVRVRARDEAGNTSTPALSTSVTLLAAPEPSGLVPVSGQVTQSPTKSISRRVARAVAS